MGPPEEPCINTKVSEDPGERLLPASVLRMELHTWRQRSFTQNARKNGNKLLENNCR